MTNCTCSLPGAILPITHLLHIDANPQGDRSVSRTLSKEFITFGFIGITEIDFIHADSLVLENEARNLAIANAQAALKNAIAH
ncbi:hypothetical protein H6F87_25595 [Cyanobacteria bacterium FACHB-502]|uniref:hypothetical protein n=1 Tax=Leptolyngbya sp. GB1-A1 TaxID=2933908 RepID=UPI0019B2AB17|nr:hypothetical protein [Cyanobacteria bacterium FACHB-502]